MTTSTTKELVIHSGGFQCMVEVTEDDTFLDVRAKIMDDFDDDMLPCPESPSDFFISIGDLRLSRKQESRRLAWSVFGGSDKQQTSPVRLQAKQKSIAIISNNGKRPAPALAAAVANNNEGNALEGRSEKKIRTNDMSTQAISSEPTPVVVEVAEAAFASPATNTAFVSPNLKDAPTSEHSNIYHTPMAPMDEGHQIRKLSTKTDDVEEMVVLDDVSNRNGDGDDAQIVDVATTEDSNNNTATTDGGTVDDTTSRLLRQAEAAMQEQESDIQISKVTNPVPENPSAKFDEAVSDSRRLLRQLSELLQNADNDLFCSETRRQEWTQEISASLKTSAPDTVIGVLGSTGVGKSSLLNALLDEANVLPTSGSRGCTAAVVELRFNQALLAPTAETKVYKGQVEFISLQEWLTELKLLLDECSTHETQTVYARTPEEQRQPDAAAAWAKINQVYGRGTMESLTGATKLRAWQRLSTNRNVVQLLTGPAEGRPNTILVEEGTVDEAQAQLLCGQLSNLKGKLRRMQKKWAGAFRNQINDYVYRKGNGGLPQTWPLIRKVVLNGPWAVLSTGACLVDLPGVRDANAARARVAQTYLQNCHLICVVAPIKRAVDDGTAKELLGEQFKRRLLMDGQYGNIIFICTQTDDIEATETMRDHEDVARKIPGRWEKMENLNDQITSIDTELCSLLEGEKDLKADLKEVHEVIKDLKEDLKDAQSELDDDDDDDDNEDMDVAVDTQQAVTVLKTKLQRKKDMASFILAKLGSKTIRDKKDNAAKLQETSASLQLVLKTMAAAVRNDYSTKCLQEDFKAGLKELVNVDHDEDKDDVVPPPLPDDYELEVHCICSNDYLKIMGIKAATDGPPNTFSRADDTHIPSLRLAVHQATARFRKAFATTFVESTSDMVDRIKLCATENREGSDSGHKFRQAFENEMQVLEPKISPIVSEFIRKAEEKVNKALQPSLASGAAKGSASAMTTVTSWTSGGRRSRQYRSPQQNGLLYQTFNATIRRQGVYVSSCAGEIDFNQELCDPMEKEFSTDWQTIMDSSIGALLVESERNATAAFAKVAQNLVAAFAQTGMEASRLQAMANTANRTCSTAIRVAFEGMKKLATDTQRTLNRSLLPKVTERMAPAYDDCNHVQRGTGTFNRMKQAMHSHVKVAVGTMFNEATTHLLKSVSGLIKQLASQILGITSIINKSMDSVYSVSWDSQQAQKLMDPATKEKIRVCRDRLLPELVSFRKDQDQAMEALRIKREEVEFDIVGVDSWESRKAKEMKEAEAHGKYFEILDSDDDDDDEISLPKPPLAHVRVKAEGGSIKAAQKSSRGEAASRASPVAHKNGGNSTQRQTHSYSRASPGGNPYARASSGLNPYSRSSRAAPVANQDSSNSMQREAEKKTVESTQKVSKDNVAPRAPPMAHQLVLSAHQHTTHKLIQKTSEKTLSKVPYYQMQQARMSTVTQLQQCFAGHQLSKEVISARIERAEQDADTEAKEALVANRKERGSI